MVGLTPWFGVFPVPEADGVDRLVEQVLLADRLGLDLVGIQDHPYQRRYVDTWTLLSYLAGRTERVRFFPDVANLPLRHPALLAKAAASLDLLSGGRVELGLGAGAFWDAIVAMDGPRRSPSEAVRSVEEAIEVMRLVQRRQWREGGQVGQFFIVEHDRAGEALATMHHAVRNGADAGVAGVARQNAAKRGEGALEAVTPARRERFGAGAFGAAQPDQRRAAGLESLDIAAQASGAAVVRI